MDKRKSYRSRKLRFAREIAKAAYLYHRKQKNGCGW